MSEVIRKGRGQGFYDDRRKMICMIRCFLCGRENPASAIIRGVCGWCGYNPNEKPPQIPTT